MKRLSGMVLLVVLAVAASALWWLADRYRASLESPLALDQADLFELERGKGLRQVGRALAQRGWVEDAWAVELYGRRHGLDARLQAGEYRVAPGTSVRELLHTMARGEVVQYRVTIPEGWNVAQMLQAVRRHPELHPLPESVGVHNLVEALDLDGIEHPEGWFLPDTYFFARGSDALKVLRRAHTAMQDALAQAWEGRIGDHPVESAYELLILASLIERETGRGDERDRIAGVFVNRLRQGMRLQTDPSLLYVQEHGVQRLTRAELERDHPYNTYTRAGLPPTPIALPGRAALEAAARPARTDDLFFVSRGDGSHHFSETYREHREAVIRYQLGGNADRYGRR
ncbi:MAG: endolytic transglycosylase MltG [Pseudomonadota bacterium]